MRYVFFIIFTCIFSTQIFAQTDAEPNDKNGEVRYISDDLFIFMHAGPGRSFRIIGSVNAGTKVALLQTDREAKYVEIIDDRQRTGWVESKFVNAEPSLRIEVEGYREAMSGKNARIEQLEAETSRLQQTLTASQQRKTDVNRQITQQLEEIAALKRRISEKDRTDKMEWFTRGAAIALISLIIGYILGLLGRKKNRSTDRFM